jgi:hypothetical protein
MGMASGVFIDMVMMVMASFSSVSFSLLWLFLLWYMTFINFYMIRFNARTYFLLITYHDFGRELLLPFLLSEPYARIFEGQNVCFSHHKSDDGLGRQCSSSEKDNKDQRDRSKNCNSGTGVSYIKAKQRQRFRNPS